MQNNFRQRFHMFSPFKLLLAALFSVASSLSLWAQETKPSAEALSAAFNELLVADVLDEATLQTGREAGLNAINLFEAQALRTLRGEGSFDGIVEAYDAVDESFTPEDSFVFATQNEWDGMGHLLRARKAQLEENAEAFETHAKQAFWLAPDMAPLLVQWINDHRLQEMLKTYRLPMEIELLNVAGETTSLAQLAEGQKAVLLDFWASWCAPCLALLPELKERADVLAPQGVVVAGMNTENLEDAKGTYESEGIEFAWLVEPESRPFSRDLRIETLPRMILVTPEGKVLFNGHPGDPLLEKALEEVGASLTPETAATTTPAADAASANAG
ncbi:MAG: TlpA family protein disulfide reductase [Opitutales bacterium]